MHVGSPLVNLALLESLKGQRISDEIDIFIPYLALSICKIEDESFDVEEIKRAFKTEFSITPPEPALKTILTRAKKRGFVKLENHRYYKVPEKLNEVVENSTKNRIEIQRSLAVLLSEFKIYAHEAHNSSINDEEAESFLYKYITDNISVFIDILSGNGFSVETKIKNKDYLTACFITHLYKNKADKLPYLDAIVKGILLANYITYADKITSSSAFRNMTVYLDSPIILGLLGYSGSIQRRSLTEFFELLKSLEIKVSVFDATIDEIERIFSAWIDDLNKNEYSKFKPKTLELLQAKGLDAIALETEKKLIENTVEKLGIEIRSNFVINEKYQCDEKALEERLRGLGLNQDLRHDITCISRIYNTRELLPVKYFDSKFSIFVTLNSALEKCAYSYFSDEHGSKTIPLVCSEKWLATVLWLKKPNLFSDLPSKILLSHAYSTIYSDDKFWHGFITRLSDLKKRGQISEKDFALVRWDKSLIQRVHDISIETGDDFKNEDVFDLVEDIKKSHSEEKDKALLELEEAKNLEIIEEAKKRQAAEINNIRIINKIKRVARFTSHVTSSLFYIALFWLLARGLYISTPNVPLFSKEDLEFDTSWATLPVAVLMLFSLFSFLFGTSIIGLYKKTQNIIFSTIVGFFEN